MGRWRHDTTSDAVYARYRARYLKNRSILLARAKERYQANRPVMLAAMEKMRDAVRTQKLLVKSRAFRAGKPGYTNIGLHIARNKQYIEQNKRVPCLDCHQIYPPYVMDFDHVRGSKRGDISTLATNGVSLTILRRELAKCECVCANCHRERTHTRQT